MFGYRGKYGFGSFAKNDSDSSALLFENEKVQIAFSPMPKFNDDKVFADTEKYFFLTDGVIFNIAEMCKSHSASGLKELIPLLYEQNGEHFFNEFRGSFSGVFYDKNRDILLIYNDHIGDRMIFFAQADDSFYFSTDLKQLVQTLPDSFERKIDDVFVLSMLSYGYSPNCQTLIKGINRVSSGCYLKISGGKMEEIQYHRFANNPNQNDEKTNIERLDALFRQAVGRILDKNKQYGYRNVMPLSAGLDSRMTVWVARQLTDEPIENVTYSQSGYYDETTPKEIAKTLGDKMHFKPLDGGDYLKNVDRAVQLTSGLVNYSGAAQVIDSFDDLSDKDTIGVVATGMLGDIIVGTGYTQNDVNQSFKFGDGALSKKLLPLLQQSAGNRLLENYPNREIYYLYVRGFNCANLGSPLVFQEFTESFSPFYDTDLLEFAYTIPLSQRFGNEIYDRWILTKYPEAARWKHNGERTIGKKMRMVPVLGKSIPLKDLPARMAMFVLKKTHIHNYDKLESGRSMNPIDSWLAGNQPLREYIDNYFKENIGRCDKIGMKETISGFYDSGTSFEKLQVISLLAGIKYLNL